MDGGFTLSLGTDLAFSTAVPDNLLLFSTTWLGFGFDLGITRFLQIGPRVSLGYGLLASTPGGGVHLDGALLVGGQVTFWIVRPFGVFIQPDGVFLFPDNVWIPRICGGFAFSW